MLLLHENRKGARSSPESQPRLGWNRYYSNNAILTANSAIQSQTSSSCRVCGI